MISNRIGPYDIERRLGEGGMGEVFLAYDKRLDRHVAIKCVRGSKEEDIHNRNRFRREARLAAKLNHSNIAQIYDVIRDEGMDAMVMEYIQGRTLRQMVEENGPLPLDQAVKLAQQVTRGLIAAHSAGLVHRDLKSENVLINELGVAKIVDFGIAKNMYKAPSEESITQHATTIGTSRAMSPEQALGKPITPVSDLFSFGVLLYEALSGASPFKGSNDIDTMSRIVSETPRSVQSLRAEVPLTLSRLVDHLLQKDPNLRPRDAREVAEALDEIANIDVDELKETLDARDDAGLSRDVVADAEQWQRQSARPNRKPTSWLLPGLTLAVILIGIYWLLG